MTVKIDYFPLSGGLNLITPPFAMKPGELLDGSNVECLINGGYGRITGYSLFDGQTVPSMAVPGTGAVKGVHVYKGEVYAVREDGTNGRLYKATASGWTEIALATLWTTGGTYRFCNYNFYGQDSLEEMFIVNGIDKPVKYDGTTVVDISVDGGPHNASCVIGHKERLLLGIGSSVFLSVVGTPTDFVAANGAAEIAFGQTVNEFRASADALIVGCRNSTQVLYGSSDADWVRSTLNESGVYAGTMESIGGQIISLDQQGVFSLAASQTYGNFAYSAVSQRVQPKIISLTARTSTPVSTINRNKSQYRLFSGNVGLYFTFSGTKLSGITSVDYAHTVECIANGEDASGNEITVFGSDDGNVYLMDSANNFDGQDITDFMMIAFNHLKSPTTNKRYRSINADAKAFGEVPTIYFRPVVDYGAPGLSINAISSQPSGISGGALWDFARWDEFYWDSQYFSEIHARISAIGRNMALIISSDGSTEGYYEIYGMTIHYSPRRLQR